MARAARLLGQPQHRLIYLCEKGVVQPDLRTAEGRGSSRGFSRRNLLEFSVALSLRQLQVPAHLIGVLLGALRELEANLAAELPSFSIPDSLRSSTSPDLRLVIGDGRLYFTLVTGEGELRLFGGGTLSEIGSTPDVRLQEVARAAWCAEPTGSPGPRPQSDADRSYTILEVRITHLAQDLPLGT
jgi:DNA-binding transcriptional MerR regulator